MDGVRNEEVRRRAGIERDFAIGLDQRVLRWFEMDHTSVEVVWDGSERVEVVWTRGENG